jgi:Amt family ammonium transporter
MRRVLAMVSLLFTFLFVMPSWAEDAPAAAAAVTQAAPAADAPAAAPAAPAAAVAAAPAADAAAAPAPVANKGDTAWMLASTLLVLLMAAPGLGLFYGGLVRTKNMLSILMQSLVVFCLLGQPRHPQPERQPQRPQGLPALRPGRQPPAQLESQRRRLPAHLPPSWASRTER